MPNKDTVNVNGKLAISRIKTTYSEDLVKAAKAENVTLPPIPSGLSAKAGLALDKATSLDYGWWFHGFGAESIPSQTSRLDANNATGVKEQFEERLTAVLEIIAADGCEANGQFIVLGSTQGNVERWTVTANVVTKERVVMTWPNGDPYRHIEPHYTW